MSPPSPISGSSSRALILWVILMKCWRAVTFNRRFIRREPVMVLKPFRSSFSLREKLLFAGSVLKLVLLFILKWVFRKILTSLAMRPSVVLTLGRTLLLVSIMSGHITRVRFLSMKTRLFMTRLVLTFRKFVKRLFLVTFLSGFTVRCFVFRRWTRRRPLMTITRWW